MGTDVQEYMHETIWATRPMEAKTITLSCGKLTTGVTVKLWTGIFMLRNLSSPETYFQAADYREQCLKDVVTQLEPELFEKVTGLDVKDFELPVLLDVFNNSLMNDATYKFKRYEDASLTYAGINRHEGEKVEGYDTVVSGEDYKNVFIAADIYGSPGTISNEYFRQNYARTFRDTCNLSTANFTKICHHANN